MISFRYHIVSVVAIFLALALGIVVGTTALSGPVTHDLRSQVSDLKGDRSHLAAQVNSLQGEVDTAGQFATTFGAQLVANTLTSKPVLVIALPGVSTGMQDAVTSQLTAAGAKITGKLDLAAAYTDPAQSNSIITLATGPAHPMSISLPETSDARVVGAALLAAVLTGHGQATDLKTVLSGFSGLHMITSDPSGIEPATTVVVLGSGSLPKNSYAGLAQMDLIGQLVGKGAKVVVAGDAGSAQGNGIVALVRNGAAKSAVSTVDNADTPFGQVSTTLAVAGALKSQYGQYGQGKGAEALFPTPAK